MQSDANTDRSRRQLTFTNFQASAIAFCFVSLALLLLAWWIGRPLWFYSDEWNAITQYPSGRLLEPFNSHLSTVPIALYQGLFHSVGFESYLPFRLLGFASYALVGFAVFRYATTQVRPWLAAALSTLLIWGSGGAAVIMLPFLMNFTIPIGCLCWMWHLSDSPSTRSRIALGAIALFAVATSGLGVIVVGAIVVELLWRHAPARDWIPVLPAVGFWTMWYVTHSVDIPSPGSGVSIAKYATQMLFGGIVALGGGSVPIGVLLIGVMVYLGFRAGFRTALRDARLASAISAPIAFALLTAYSRIGVVPAIPPDETRYRWAIAAWIVLVVIRLAHHISQRTMSEGASNTVRYPRMGRFIPSVIIALIAANAITLFHGFHAWVDRARITVQPISAALWGLEAAWDAPAPNFDRTLPLSFVRITAGDYRDAQSMITSPMRARSLNTVAGRTPQHFEADQWLIAELQIAIEPLPRESLDSSCDTPRAFVKLPAQFEPGDRLQIDTGDEPVALELGVLSPGIRLPELDANATYQLQLPEMSERVDDAAYQIGTRSGTQELRLC